MLALIIASGCARNLQSAGPRSAELPPRAYRPPPAWDSSGRPVSSELSPVRSAPQGQTMLIATQRLSSAEQPEPVAPGMVEPLQTELIHIKGSWRQVDVREVLHLLIAEHLERDYVLDPAVQGQISLELDEEMTRRDLMDLIGGIGSIYNWAFEQRGDILFIRPGQRVAQLSHSPVIQASPAVADENAAVRVRRLRYISADQLTSLLAPFASEGAVIAHWGRMLIMADSTRQLTRLARLVAAIDVPPFQDAEIWTYQLTSRDPVEAAQLLQSLMPVSGLTVGGEPMAAPIALPGTDRLMIVARDASVHPMVGDLLREIDRPVQGESRRRYIYRVQHFPIADLYNLVRSFFADRIASADPGAPATRTGADLMDIQIAPNSDILLINATPTDYAELLGVLSEIDRPPLQVDIQSIIAEVRLSNRLEFGVEYFLSLEGSLGALELIGSAPLTGIPTGSAFFVGGDGFALISALDSESEARIISQPRIVLQDRATSSIQVGGEVPVLRASEGSSTQTGGTSAIREEIEYRNTGVILTIQADINESGLVSLNIRQEIRDALPTDIANQPEFTTRTIETRVTVPHGQTVLLGGIISTDDQKEKSRIPVLGRLPVVGAAFGQTLDRSERSELVLAITPTIIAEPRDARRALGEFLQAAQTIRAALHAGADDLPHGALYDARPEPLIPIDPSSSAPLPYFMEPQPARPGALDLPFDPPATRSAPPPITSPTTTGPAPFPWPAGADHLARSAPPRSGIP